jgi:hypothetical protein
MVTVFPRTMSSIPPIKSNVLSSAFRNTWGSKESHFSIATGELGASPDLSVVDCEAGFFFAA